MIFFYFFYFFSTSTCTHHFLATILSENNKNRLLYVHKYILRSLGVDIVHITIIWHLKRSIWTKSASRRTWAIYKSRFGLCLARLLLCRSPLSRLCTDRQKGRIAENSWAAARQSNVGVISDASSTSTSLSDLTGQTWLDVCQSEQLFVVRLSSLVCCLVWSQLRVICCSAALRRICSCAHSPIHSFIPFIRSFVRSIVCGSIHTLGWLCHRVIYIFAYLRYWHWLRRFQFSVLRGRVIVLRVETCSVWAGQTKDTLGSR